MYCHNPEKIDVGWKLQISRNVIAVSHLAKLSGLWNNLKLFSHVLFSFQQNSFNYLDQCLAEDLVCS